MFSYQNFSAFEKYSTLFSCQKVDEKMDNTVMFVWYTYGHSQQVVS